MDATLTFEHGEGLRIIQLWVTRILLWRLFRERLTLGQAIKSFAKFQCWEIMQGLVKLNDLEEVAEPPLGGTPEATTSGLPKDKMLDLEVDNVVREDDTRKLISARAKHKSVCFSWFIWFCFWLILVCLAISMLVMVVTNV